MIRTISALAFLFALTTTSIAETFLPHPAGCPRVRFCGCGAYKHLTGQVVTRGTWAQSSYWVRHYKGATRIAVWRGHVAIIDRMTGPNTAMLYDYNSGGHKSRYHERSLRGARIIGGVSYSYLLK